MKKQAKRIRIMIPSYVMNGLTMSIMLALFTVFSVVPSILHAAEEKMPEGETILDRYVEATGGMEAYEDINNRVTRGTFEIVQAGIKATMTIYHARPNRMYTLLESDALGKIEKGSNDEVAWELSVMSGPRIMEGQEKAGILLDATFDKFANWRKIYEKAECIGVETINSNPCFKVVMTPKTGKPPTLYFDCETNLLVKVKSIIEHQMGDIPIEVFISYYIKVDSILISKKSKVKVMNQERIITIDSIEHNAEIPKDIFTLPNEIYALVNGN